MLAAKQGGDRVATVHDFVEDWIEIRARLQRQLKLLESGQMGAADKALGGATAARIKKWIDELNALLKEHAAADRV